MRRPDQPPQSRSVMPRFTREHVRCTLDTTFPTAIAAVKLLESRGIVGELTGQKTNRSYSYAAQVALLTRGASAAPWPTTS